MKIAYLIDVDSLGGGCEYVRRKSDEARARQDICRTFYSAAGECTPSEVDAWGAEEIVVNHLKALMQLLGNPLRRPKGRVTFVVHGIHLRKYDWQLRECGGGFRWVRPWLCRALRRRLECWLYHRCDRLVALTTTDREDIRRFYGCDLAVDVEPNTLDGWAPDQATELPAGIVGPFDYLCIGRFDYQKGQDRLIRWLAERHLDERVLFIGDGATRAACENLAQRLGVAGRCAFVGAVPQADRFLTSAKVVVSPSRWEGMPYLLMKARALNCRILATDCPGNRDVLAGYERWDVLAC